MSVGVAFGSDRISLASSRTSSEGTVLEHVAEIPLDSREGRSKRLPVHQ